MSTNRSYLNSISFASFFQEVILDNNGIPVTDINAGLQNLFVNFNENADNFFDEQRFYVSENEEGFPDLVAYLSILGDQNYWWWVLLLNRLENPFLDIKVNWIYSINSADQIQSFINNTNETNSSRSTNRLGKLVELN